MAKWPWIIRVIWDPVQELDLTDADGKPDHGKVLPAILLVSAIIFQALGVQYAWYALLALGSLSYGYGAWRAFLKSKSVTGAFKDTKTETITRTFVSKTRDSEAGFDPTD